MVCLSKATYHPSFVYSKQAPSSRSNIQGIGGIKHHVSEIFARLDKRSEVRKYPYTLTTWGELDDSCSRESLSSPPSDTKILPSLLIAIPIGKFIPDAKTPPKPN